MGILAKFLQITPRGVERKSTDSENIANGDHEEDPTNDSSQEKAIARCSFQRENPQLHIIQLAKKASLARVLSQTQGVQAYLDKGEKGVSNQIRDVHQDQHNKGQKEKMPWAPKPKEPKKSWGNIVQKSISTRRQVGNT